MRLLGRRTPEPGLLGDTVTGGELLQYTGLPFFAPEMFRTVELADPMKSKQLAKGLKELGEEGAIQVFKPLAGSLMLLGAVGQLQFEVVQHRLKTEYGVDVRLSPANFAGARWISCDSVLPDVMALTEYNISSAPLFTFDSIAFRLASTGPLPSDSAWNSTLPAEKATLACGRSPVSECWLNDSSR